MSGFAPQNPPTSPAEVAQDAATAAAAVDATTTVKGKVKLANDFSGTADLPVVAKVNGITYPSGSLTTGQVPRATGASTVAYGALDLSNSSAITGTLPDGNQAAQTMAGDVTGTTGASTVAKIKGTTITTAGGSLAVGAVLRTTAAGTADWGTVDLADTDAVTGVLPVANQAAQTLSGDVTGTTAASVVTAGLKRQSQTVVYTDLTAFGAVSNATINVGAALPSNSRLLGAEINTTIALDGTGIVSAVASVQGSTDVAGTIITGASVMATGLVGINGTNQYLSRGSQQIQVKVVVTGITLDALTAGSFTVNLFYAVIA